MVPVPEELAPKVLSYVSWKGQPRLGDASQPTADTPATTVEAPPPDNGDEPLARVFARLDDAGRALAKVIALASLDQAQLTVSEAARRAGVSTREAAGMILELGNLVVSAGGPPLAAFIKDGEGATAGEFSWDTRVVVMQEAVARSLADLVRTQACG